MKKMVKVWSGEAWQGQTVTTTQDIIGQFILFKTTWEITFWFSITSSKEYCSTSSSCEW
ncbi:hypothetical protein IC611_16125 [Proteus mirabilis]